MTKDSFMPHIQISYESDEDNDGVIPQNEDFSFIKRSLSIRNKTGMKSALINISQSKTCTELISK